jgi:hypothetical protein
MEEHQFSLALSQQECAGGGLLIHPGSMSSMAATNRRQ